MSLELNQIVEMSRRVYLTNPQNMRLVLECFFCGPINPKTGLLVNLMDLEPDLKTIAQKYEAKLNENIFSPSHFASQIYAELQKHFKNSKYQDLKFKGLKIHFHDDFILEILK